MSNVQVAKLSLVDGQRRQAPPEMGQIAAHGGTFYLLVEVSAPTEAWDNASRQIVARAISTFAASKLGETGALQAAAETINDFLLARNRELPKEDHVWAGFNALFLDGDHLYLAQAGPALTYIARGDSLTRFPRSFDDLRTSRLEALTPLGERENIKCRLAHFQLQPGDMITLAASHLPTMASESAILELVRGDNVEGILDGLARIARHEDFSALVLNYGTVSPQPAPAVEATDEGEDEDEWIDEEEWVDEDEWLDEEVWDENEEDEWLDEEPPAPARPAPKVAPEPGSSPPPRQQEAPRQVPPRSEPPRTSPPRSSPPPRQASPRQEPSATPRERRAAPKATPAGEPEIIPSTARRVEQKKESPGSRPARPKKTAAKGAPLPQPAPAVASAGSESFASNWQPLLRRAGAALAAAGAALLALLSRLVAWWQQVILPRLHAAAPALDALAYRIWRGGYRGWHALTRVLRQLLPGDHSAPPPRPDVIPPPPGDGSGFLRTLVLVVPLLILLAVVAIGWTSGEEGEAAAPVPQNNYASLVAEAKNLISQANNVDEGTAEQLLQRANDLLLQAEALEAEAGATGEVAQLRLQAQQLLDRAANVSRPPVLTLATTGPESDPTQLSYGQGMLFAVEQSRGAAYRILLDQPAGVLDSITPLLAAQQRFASGTIAGTPRYLAWIPAGGGRGADSLLVLTDLAQLFAFEPSTMQVKLLTFSPVVSPEIVTAGGYEGNFYLLDRANQQIWKYSPDALGEYGQAPLPWLTPSGQQQLGTPIDMAIDGFIYLLDGSGEVGRFQLGERKAFALDPVTPPLTNPVAIAKVPPETTDMFVADSQRVVRFDQNGRFLVEYRAPLGSDWGTIQDIAVDEKNESLYILSDTGIYLVDIRGSRRAPAPQSSPQSSPRSSPQPGATPRPAGEDPGM